MIDSVPLIGSVAQGFNSTAPTMNAPITGSDEELKGASKDFISTLFSYMFQVMRGGEEQEEGSLFSGDNMHMFMGFLDQEMGKKFAEQDGSGLVNALYDQLKGNNKNINASNSNNLI